MDEQAIGGFLEELASSAPAPGGGAAAALEAAMGAALVEMVCNLTIGRPAHAAAEQTMLAARARATELRTQALALAADDAAAFRAVIEAYRLPREAPEQALARVEAIQRALAAASDVPRRTALAAAEVVALAESIVAGANPNVVSDAAAGAASARAALEIARVNIEVNAASITDPVLSAALARACAEIEQEVARADRVVAAVRGRLAS